MNAVGIVENRNEVDRKNAEWRIRLHRQLDALCDDVEARKGFNGSVEFQMFWRGRRFDRFETNIRQTVAE